MSAGLISLRRSSDTFYSVKIKVKTCLFLVTDDAEQNQWYVYGLQRWVETLSIGFYIQKMFMFEVLEQELKSNFFDIEVFQ